MRNKYPAPCYKCGARVEPDDGYFERHKSESRVQHIACVQAPPSFASLQELIGNTNDVQESS
jgi:hypothetical protein